MLKELKVRVQSLHFSIKESIRILHEKHPLHRGAGFILTRHRLEESGATYLVYWLASTDGPIKLITKAQPDVFFVRQCDHVLVEKALAGKTLSSSQIHSQYQIHSLYQIHSQNQVHYQYKALDLKNFEQEPVAALYFSTSRDMYIARKALRSAAITCYEDDVRLTERFLMERFVYGSANYAGIPGDHIAKVNKVSEKKAKFEYGCFTQIQLQPSANPKVPHLKRLSLDIECSEKGVLYSIGLVTDIDAQVLMIGDSQAAPDWVFWVPNEKALLEKFVEAVVNIDPDILIGWNVVNFDFRLLIERAKLHQVRLALGRDGTPIQWRNRRDESNQGFVSLPGRLVIDGIDALKSATYYFESFSLEFVAQQLLGKGKQVQDVDNRMETINYDFQHNKVKLAEYNRQDCQLVLEIFDQTKIMSFLMLRSQLTGLALDRFGGSVAAFLNLYLPKLHRAGYVSPIRPPSGGLTSPGGYVMRSHPGLYRNVLVLDFKSLYPSIIRTFKIDPMGLIEGLKKPIDVIPGFKGALFSRDQHFLPDIISTLWQQRDEAKKQKEAARSQAIKILMNSFYGILGSGGCPFYDPRLASSITMRGHEIMKITAQWIEEMGHKVIYGDTDSTFVWLEGNISSEDARSIGKRLQEKINQRWDQRIKEEYQLESSLEIEFETHFKRFLMPTIRGSKVGSKKRYAGLKCTIGGEELVFKGLETVRSDWTALAKSFQKKLYAMIFSDQDVKGYLRAVVADTRLGKYDDQLVYRKRLRRPLYKYVKNVPPHVRAARLADQRNQAKGKSLRYQHKGTIAYVISRNGPEPLEYRSSPIDYEHYIEKQIRPIAEGILPFVNLSYETIVSPQLSLF